MHIALFLTVALIFTQAAARADEPAWPAINAAGDDCLANLPRMAATVKSITDGDTLVLSDNRRVRLIGFNTPELRGRQGSTEPFAETARDELAKLVQPGDQIQLVMGSEKHDRHGRVLAHVLTDKNLHIAEHMLSNGLAAYSAVAPNTRCVQQFATTEQQAIEEQRGLWSQPSPWFLDAEQLGRKSTGFRIVTGTISSVRETNKYFSLNMNNKLQIDIRKALADELPMRSLIGKSVSIRGWISKRKNRLHVRLHHPANLVTVD